MRSYEDDQDDRFMKFISPRVLPRAPKPAEDPILN